MENVDIKQSVISISALVGDLTSKKFEIIKEALNEFILESNGNLQIFNFKTKQDYLITITQNSINFYFFNNKYNKEEIKEIANIILDKLMIDSNVQAFIDVQGQSETENSFNESANLYKEKHGESFENLFGVGYRYFIKGENYTDDLKKEPLLSNQNFFFYQLTRNFNTSKIPVNYIIDQLENIYNDINKYFK